MATYLVVQIGLISTSALLPDESFAGALNLAAIAIGSAALITGIARQRPLPIAGWWLIAASAGAQLAAAIGAVVLYGLSGAAEVSAVTPALLAALSPPLLAAGLALLGGRWGESAVDLVDSAMLAVGWYVVLWAVVIGPALEGSGARVVAAVVFPIGILLVVVTGFRLILAGALRDPVLRLVLVAAGLLILAGVLVLLPAFQAPALVVARGTALVWVCSSFLFGLAGLHPRLARAAVAPAGGAEALSKWRIVLFAMIALIAPVVLAVELASVRGSLGGRIGGVATALVAAVVLLMLLVLRLALIARVAQRRAEELVRRTRALAAAISEQEALQRELAYQARHDPLTGLANRGVLDERLVEALRHGTGPHALLMLDLDGFKEVNDTLGHPVGDELLVAFSARLVRALPTHTLVVRLGGDEFAALLEATDPDPAWRSAEGVLDAIRRPFDVAGRELTLTASIGLLAIEPAMLPLTASEALRDADLALYEAKSTGRSRVVRFEPGLRARRMDHARISDGLRRALARDELVLLYQPVLDLTSRRVVAVEALLRWREPNGRLVDSAEFTQVAEETGLGTPLLVWSLRRACLDARRWYGEHSVLTSVNITARQLGDEGFADLVLRVLREAEVPGKALVLELTEEALVESAQDDAMQARLRQVRGHGVHLAVDDFGSGFAALSYVAKLQVDLVKVDSSFIQPGGGPESQALAQAVVQLIEGLTLQAVAEGIDTPEQEAALGTLRFRLAQGCQLGRPASAETIVAQLAARPGPAAAD